MKIIFKNFLNCNNHCYKVLYFTILGPDGAGKSTLISMLIEKYNKSFTNYYSHLYPDLYFINKKQNIYPYSKKPYSLLMSILKLIYMCLRNLQSYFFISLTRKKNNSIIWIDRNLLDIFADPLRYRINFLPVNLKFINNLFCKSNLVIILNPPAESILKRSNQLSIEQLIRLNRSYTKIKEYLPEALLIDYECSLEESLEKCTGYIDHFLKSRER